MEVSYKRHFGQSYMIWKGEGTEYEPHELSVLSYNRIPGLLTVETQIADGEAQFWYDITGKHTLADYLERNPVDRELLFLLFRALETICREIPAYLLEEQRIMLEPEYLYLDFAHENLEFVYLPGVKEDIRLKFQELMEQLLKRLNHSDKQATAMAYEMYQRSLQRETSFFQMFHEAMAAEFVQTRQEEELRQADLQQEEAAPDVKEVYTEAPPEHMGWLKGKLGARIKYERSSKGSHKKAEGKLYRPPLEQAPPVRAKKETPIAYPTEVLSLSHETQGLLIYQGDRDLSDIRINKPVFLIGKKEKQVDACIESRSVSRIHARLECVEEAYYIEDLNSTNGTYLNGQLLEYRQKVKLSPRDRITFGMEEYLFI